jgi:HAD superfamily hydrolase (TIGR01549 family)
MYECVIFDVDGTLIDTEKASVLSLQKLLREEASTIDPGNDLSFIMGLTGVEALKRFGVKNAEAANIRWNRYLKDYYHWVKVFRDIEVLLKKLVSLGIKTGIVTSKTRQELKDDLSPFGLQKYFPFTVCADDTLRHKPDSEPIFKIMDLVNVKPKQMIYIGDTENDLLAAKSAEVDFGLAVWGAEGREFPGAQHRFINPLEVIRVVTVK